MVNRGSNVGYKEVIRSLRRSRVRTEILMYLYRYYPKAFYPAEIAQNTGVAPRSILGGLKGMGRLDASNSLIKKKLVEEVEQENATYYRLSEHGKSLVESMRCQKAFI